MAILDGEFIDDKDIDPAKHKFVGTFREPFSAYEDMAGEFHCRCGEHLFNQQSILDHWQKGHMDAPQYVTVDGKSEKIVTLRHYCKGKGLITECFETADNKFYARHPMDLNYCSLTQVNYCPYCGKKAPKQVGE